jgi:hypothetical protein
MLELSSRKIADDLNRFFTISELSFRSYLQEQRTQHLIRDWTHVETNIVGMVSLVRDYKDIHEVNLIRNGQSIAASANSVTIRNGTTRTYDISIQNGRVLLSNAVDIQSDPLEPDSMSGWHYSVRNGSIFVRYSLPQWLNLDLDVRGTGTPFVVHSMHLVPRLERILLDTKPTANAIIAFLSPNLTNLVSNQNFPIQDIRLSSNSFLAALSEFITKVMILETETTLIAPYFARIHTVKIRNEVMGYVIVGIPITDTFEDFRLANTRAAIFGTCFTLIALGLVGGLGWCIVRPIHEMRLEMVHFSKSDIKKVQAPKLVFSRFSEILKVQMTYKEMIQKVSEKVQEIYFPVDQSDYYYIIRPSALTTRPKFSKGDESADLELEPYKEPSVHNSFFGIGRKQPKSLRSLSKFSNHSADSLDSEESDSIDSSVVNGVFITGPHSRKLSKPLDHSVPVRAQLLGAEGRVRRHSTKITSLFPKLRSEKLSGSHSVIVIEEVDVDKSKFAISKNLFKSLDVMPKKPKLFSNEEGHPDEFPNSTSVDNISRGSNSARSSLSRSPDPIPIAHKAPLPLQPTNFGPSLPIPAFQRRRESTMTTSTQETSQLSQEALGFKPRGYSKEEDGKVAQSRETIDTNCTDRSDIDDSILLYVGSTVLFPTIREEAGTENLEPHPEIEEPRDSVNTSNAVPQTRDSVNTSQL